jgi:acetyl-CoA acetyltransferase
LIGAPGISGSNIGRACATSAQLVAQAAAEVELGHKRCVLSVACDRTSNGPHIYYPNPLAPGGRGDAEDWVWDNFNFDPLCRNAMIETAENVAREAGISKEEQDQITLLRHAQYSEALADDRAFQKRYMPTVELAQGKKTKLVATDEGVFPTTAEGLAKLRPVQSGGTTSYGTQTFPADGNAGLVLCDAARAEQLSADKRIRVQLLSWGEARVKAGFMPLAVVPAAQRAAERAGVKIADCKAIKTHNPFAVNDVYFCRETGVPAERVNRFGSPLIYGHPQAPTGLRATIELIEELALAGGGVGLFSGCAAGDTAMALVVRVS